LEQDVEMGLAIAQEKGCDLSLADFTETVYNRLDYNRFDYEGGEREMFKAIICIFKGYMLGGGNIDFAEVMPIEESKRAT